MRPPAACAADTVALIGLQFVVMTLLADRPTDVTTPDASAAGAVATMCSRSAARPMCKMPQATSFLQA